MTTRCIIRNLLLSSATLALAVWPSFSKAVTIANPDVVTWTSAQPGLFLPSTQYPTLSAWDAGAATAGVAPGAFAPSGLTYTGGLNLTNNDLIIQADNATDAVAAYTNIANAAAVGYNGTLWTGSGGGGPSNSTGIYSDSSAINPNAPSGATDGFAITGIGVVLNDLNTNNFFGNDTGYTSFDGVAVGPNTVLAKYTYYGDTALRGFVDQNDIVAAEDGRDFGLIGFQNGETQFRGFVDQSDIVNIENSRDFASSDPIVLTSNPSAIAFNSGAVAVPEPSAGLMGLLAAIGIIAVCFVHSRRFAASCASRA